MLLLDISKLFKSPNPHPRYIFKSLCATVFINKDVFIFIDENIINKVRISNLNLISTESTIFATLTKFDMSLQNPLTLITQQRSPFELVSFLLIGRELIEVVIKAGG